MESKLIPTLICIFFAALMFALMWWGWKSRQKRQVSWGKLAEVPAGFDEADPLLAVDGTYVCTTNEGDWLDRVAVETLGFKSQAMLLVYPDGIIFNRTGAKDIWIPRIDIQSVRTESGMNGKFVEKNGLLVVSWKFNKKNVDTGFRTQVAEEKTLALRTIQELI